MSESRDGRTGLSSRPDRWARRRFLAALAGGLLAAPLAAEGQQAGKVYRIGMLVNSDGPLVEVFRQELRT